jgi:hypothetical protein
MLKKFANERKKKLAKTLSITVLTGPVLTMATHIYGCMLANHIYEPLRVIFGRMKGMNTESGWENGIHAQKRLIQPILNQNGTNKKIMNEKIK